MSNFAQAPVPPSVFTNTLTGKIPDGPFLFRNDELGVAAILSDRYVNPGHGVIFSTRQVETIDDLTESERYRLDVVTHALRMRIKEVYAPLRVAEHTEGFEVPHAHRVVFPVFARGESDRLNHKELLTVATPEYYQRVIGELSLTDDMVRRALPVRTVYEPLDDLSTLVADFPF